MFKKIIIVSIIMLIAAGATWAQTNGFTVPQEPDRLGVVTPGEMSPVGTDGYGIQNYFAAVTPANTFQTYNTGLGHLFWMGGYIGPQAGDPYRYFDAPVYLPTGALINSVKIPVYDDDATGYVHVWLWLEECVSDSGCTSTGLADEQTGAAEIPGYTLFSSSDAVGMTWRNFDSTGGTFNYGFLRVYFSVASNDLRVGPVWIWYQRQISPAPSGATFPDVGTGFWAFREIEALASSGITTGYPDGTYRPLEPVTRAQMATFLARALGLDFPDF